MCTLKHGLTISRWGYTFHLEDEDVGETFRDAKTEQRWSKLVTESYFSYSEKVQDEGHKSNLNQKLFCGSKKTSHSYLCKAGNRGQP